MSLKSLPECCLILYLCYSCSTLRKATLIVISGYGVMPSVLKTSFTGETGKWKGFRDNVRPLWRYYVNHSTRLREGNGILNQSSSTVVHWKKWFPTRVISLLQRRWKPSTLRSITGWQNWPWTNCTIVFPLQSGNMLPDKCFWWSTVVTMTSLQILSALWLTVTYAVLCMVLIPGCGLTSSVAPGKLWTCTSSCDNVFFKNYASASSCVTEHEEETWILTMPIPVTKWIPSSWRTLISIWIHYSGSIRSCYRSEWILLTEKHIQLRMRLQVRHVRGDAATD